MEQSVIDYIILDEEQLRYIVINILLLVASHLVSIVSLSSIVKQLKMEHGDLNPRLNSKWLTFVLLAMG